MMNRLAALLGRSTLQPKSKAQLSKYLDAFRRLRESQKAGQARLAARVNEVHDRARQTQALVRDTRDAQKERERKRDETVAALRDRVNAHEQALAQAPTSAR
jgi:hypothetical protein